jgi:hypothetical protein
MKDYAHKRYIYEEFNFYVLNIAFLYFKLLLRNLLNNKLNVPVLRIYTPPRCM